MDSNLSSDASSFFAHSLNSVCRVFHCLFHFVFYYRNFLYAFFTQRKPFGTWTRIDLHRVSTYVPIMLTSNTGIVCDTNAAEAVKCNSSHFASASCSMFIISIILGHWIAVISCRKKKTLVNDIKIHICWQIRMILEWIFSSVLTFYRLPLLKSKYGIIFK